eukprot:TRINITY_DN2059_c0_g1_i1.p1 TRINITY_DN2059_c0_g1~~TRINITY_DN2059_c0_g1_i1.p1  ORF type:complete len:201 (-),score=38.38 TRINITY_DN2059_c0_g1_i1:69-641(-)
MSSSDEGDEKDPVFAQYYKELDEIQAATGKIPFVLDDPRGPKVKIEQLRKLPYFLMTKQAGEHHDRIYERLDEECDGLFMVSGRHSYIMYNHWEQEMDNVKRLQSRDPQGSFDNLLGLTMVMVDVDHWYNDVEDTSVVEAIMKKMKTLWAKALLLPALKDDERAKLTAWLKKFGKSVKEMEYGPKFTWFK